MADIDWPSALRGAIQSTKQISQAAGFIENDPAAGPAYTEFFTDDQPVFMSFDLRFTRTEAIYFESWARANNIFKFGTLFNFPIYDEYGLNTQEVRFLSAGKPVYAENGLVRNYTGCQIIIPDYQRPDADAISSYIEVFGFGDLYGEWAAIDNGLNNEYPEV